MTESFEDPVVCWVVRFDLPFTVSIQDSFDDPTLRAFVEESEAGASPDPVAYSPRLAGRGIVAGSLLHVPSGDALGEPVEVAIESGEVRLYFLRRIRNVDVPIVMGGELRPCRGHSSFSSVQAVLSIRASRDITEMSEAARIALEATNRFLEFYRYFTGAYWAQPIGLDSTPTHEIDSHHESGKVIGGRVSSTPEGGPLRMGGEPLVDESRGVLIQSKLSTVSESSPLAFELICLARDHRARGRHRNAIIDAASAFEVFLAEFVTEQGRRASETTAEATNRLLRDDSGFWHDISTLAKAVLREEVGIDFAGTAQFRDWDQFVRTPRNSVIHGVTDAATPEVADRAISTAEAAVRKLQELDQQR